MNGDEQGQSAKESWGYERVSLLVHCLPLVSLIVWIMVDREFSPIGEMWPFVAAVGLMTVGLLRTGVTLTADELLIRYPVGSLRLRKDQVGSGRRDSTTSAWSSRGATAIRRSRSWRRA